MRPSRRTVAVVTSIFFRASSEASALDSWTNPMVALSSTTSAITTGVSHSRVTTRLTTAAISRMMISRSWNCRRNARHRGSRRASANRFGPSRSNRWVASVDDNPSPTSTSRRSAASAAEVACQNASAVAVSVMSPSCWSSTVGNTAATGRCPARRPAHPRGRPSGCAGFSDGERLGRLVGVSGNAVVPAPGPPTSERDGAAVDTTHDRATVVARVGPGRRRPQRPRSAASAPSGRRPPRCRTLEQRGAAC